MHLNYTYALTLILEIGKFVNQADVSKERKDKYIELVTDPCSRMLEP